MAYPAPDGKKASNFPGKNKKWDENETLVATAAYETLTEEERSTAKTNQAKLVYDQLRAWYPKWTRPITGQKMDFLASKSVNRSLCQQLEDEKDAKEELQKKADKKRQEDADALQKTRAYAGHVNRKNKKLVDEIKKLEEDLAADLTFR